MSGRSTNTMQEWLLNEMKSIAEAKTLTDADLPWLVEFESMVLAKLKAPVQELVQQGQLPPDPMQQQFGGGSPAGSLQGGGLMAGSTAPSGGELARFLGAGENGL